MTARRDVLAIVEASGSGVPVAALEVLGLARQVADALGGTVHACVLGSGLEGIGAELVAHGADRVHGVDAPALAPYQADAWMPDALALIAELEPTAVLAAHTVVGADFAPRLAFRLGTAVATACNRAAVEDGRLRVTRTCYGGKAEEVVSFRTAPAVVTVKPRSFRPCPRRDAGCGETLWRRSVLEPAAVRTRVRASRRDESDAVPLETARVVVAGGGGMKGPQGFEIAGRLAGLLGGAVGASRVACDLGWCPPSRQVGLSGKTVAPDLYMAIGISGAGHHMAGCGNAGTIVAINTDPDAPIFRHARYGVVADGQELMQALIDALRAPTE